MAEAAYGDVSTESPPKYFCHSCSSPVDVSPDLPDLVCPKCESGCIEELTQDLQAEYTNQRRPRVLLGNRDVSSVLSGFRFNPADIGEESDDTDNDDREDFWNVDWLRDRHDRQRQAQDSQDHVPVRAEASSISGLVEHILRGLTGNTSSTNRTEGILPFLTPFFHGDPRDYAWGADGLDNAITQLLNQWEGSEIQPATKEAIDGLQSMEVTQEHIDKELQCSICLEDFSIGSALRCLPCQHLFHTSCIVTWLEMHNSCPICRQSVGDSMVESAACVMLPASTDSSDCDDDDGCTNQPTGSTSAASSSDSGLVMTYDRKMTDSDRVTFGATRDLLLHSRSRSSSSSSSDD